MQRRKMLIDLTSAKGIAGNEDEVRSLFKKYAAPYADKFLYDGLGSIIAKMLVIKKDQKSTFLGIWMKSVSWLPKSQKKAFKISNRWWLVGQVMLAQQVQIKTTTGKVYHGVIGSKPPHVLTAEVRNKP